jgi:FAD/FMN-containing dehydrogenase
MTMTLHETIRGRLTLPGDPEWDRARGSWNLSVDQRPAAVAEVASPRDVQAVVRHAAREGLRVAPQATGHGSEALGPLDGTVLLKTSALRGIEVHPEAGTVRVEAGALAGEVAAAADAHGLAPVLGLAPTVGVAGFALGGGTGWLSRAHGLGGNNVRALEVVTAGGELLRVDATTEPDLFWALRGGGGRCAVVTALELEAHPLGEVSAGMVAWPAEHAADVLDQFRGWTADAPESLGAVLRYLDLPAIDAVPAPLRGRRIVAVIAVHAGTEAAGRRVMVPLRASPAPLLDTFGPVGPVDLVRVAGDPEEPAPARGHGFLAGGLEPSLVDALAGLIAGDGLAPLGAFELRLLGGALARAAEGHGALARLDGAFSVFAGGVAPDAAARVAVDERLEAVRARLAPWAMPQALLNNARGGTDPARAFDEATWARLGRVRAAYDPGRLIVSNHPEPGA